MKNYKCLEKLEQFLCAVVVIGLVCVALEIIDGEKTVEDEVAVKVESQVEDQMLTKDFNESDERQEAQEVLGIKLASIERSEIYNEHGISIKAEELKIENKKTEILFSIYNSSEKDYSISAHSYSINGIMAGGNKYGSDVNVPTGKNAKFSAEIRNDWLSENGIDEIKKIDVIFWMYADNFKEFNSDVISIYTDAYTDDLEAFIPNGEEIYSDDTVTLWYSDDNKFILLNKTNYNAGYTIENASVNDWSYELINYTYDLYDIIIHENSYSIFTIPIEKDFLKENNLEKAENIEFDILLKDDYWDYNGLPWKYKTPKIRIEF